MKFLVMHGGCRIGLDVAPPVLFPSPYPPARIAVQEEDLDFRVWCRLRRPDACFVARFWADETGCGKGIFTAGPGRTAAAKARRIAMSNDWLKRQGLSVRDLRLKAQGG